MRSFNAILTDGTLVEFKLREATWALNWDLEKSGSKPEEWYVNFASYDTTLADRLARILIDDLDMRREVAAIVHAWRKTTQT